MVRDALLEVLFTFWPPGPEEREKRQASSAAPITSAGVSRRSAVGRRGAMDLGEPGNQPVTANTPAMRKAGACEILAMGWIDEVFDGVRYGLEGTVLVVGMGRTGDAVYRVLEAQGESPVGLDADPAKGEDVRPFLHVAAHLTQIGLSAPTCLAQDIPKGFLLWIEAVRIDAPLAQRVENALTRK